MLSTQGEYRRERKREREREREMKIERDALLLPPIYNLCYLDMQCNRLTKVEYDAKLTFLIVTHPH